MARCDFPCCGHEAGCCPNYDASGRQLDMVCVCGARLPVTARYSLCHHCMKQEQVEEGIGDEEAMDEAWDVYGEEGDLESGIDGILDETPMFHDYYGGE